MPVLNQLLEILIIIFDSSSWDQSWKQYLERQPWHRDSSVQFSSVQSLSRVRLFATPWIAARQASLSITNSQSSPKLMSIESVMPSCHLILCHTLLLLLPTSPSIRVFSNESTLRMRCPKYWSFSFPVWSRDPVIAELCPLKIQLLKV